MHEAAIAQSILNTVIREAEKRGAARVESVEIEIGALTFLGTEQIRFWLDAGFQNTLAEGAEILFKTIEARIHCAECDFRGPLPVREDPAYHLNLPRFSCPECGSSKITVTQGREALIRNIKIRVP